MARYEKKIYKVTIMGNDYFAYGLTKQGAINAVFEAIKGSGMAELAHGKDIFEYGKDGGIILGDSVDESEYQLTIEGITALQEKAVQSFADALTDIPENEIPEAVAC